MRRAILSLFAGTLVACAAPRSAPFREGGSCSGDEYRALDFWTGDWDVKSPSGEVLGTNAITKTLGGCAIEERWTDAAGKEGMSLFFFDRARHAWKQVWVTEDGGWKEKAEVPGVVPGGLRFQGEVPRAEGDVAVDRTTLRRLPDNSGVQQLIERSTDGGKTWESWTGIYTERRVKEACRGAHRQFDFWVGEWDVVVKSRTKPDADTWSEQRGTNRVTRVLEGCGVEESFSAGAAAAGWAGKSLSRFVDAESRWRQTWIDDGGGYLAFAGEMKGNEMVLIGEPRTAAGVTTVMRMVYADITPTSFLWRWEASRDGGATWIPRMLISYARKRRS